MILIWCTIKTCIENAVVSRTCVKLSNVRFAFMRYGFRVSQHFDVGPSYYFRKCRNLHSKKCLKVTRFFAYNKN